MAERKRGERAMITPITKRCNRCKEDKPLTSYSPNRWRKDGLQGNCKACAVDKERIRRSKNPERFKIEQHRLYLASAEKVKARARRYYEDNKDRAIAHNREYVKAHPEKAREYREKNKERLKAVERARRKLNTVKLRSAYLRWCANNPDKRRASARIGEMNRRARDKSAFVERVDPKVIYARANGVCGICGDLINVGERFHVDHIKPISRGGEHSYSNTQPAHVRCNLSKGSKWQT
jgi:5-methylcytosine-specific restriction endonuclease McrA